MLLLGSSVSRRLRLRMWVLGTPQLTRLSFRTAARGSSCPRPANTVFDCRETLARAPSFTGFAPFSLLTTKCTQ